MILCLEKACVHTSLPLAHVCLHIFRIRKLLSLLHTLHSQWYVIMMSQQLPSNLSTHMHMSDEMNIHQYEISSQKCVWWPLFPLFPNTKLVLTKALCKPLMLCNSAAIEQKHCTEYNPGLVLCRPVTREVFLILFWEKKSIHKREDNHFSSDNHFQSWLKNATRHIAASRWKKKCSFYPQIS